MSKIAHYLEYSVRLGEISRRPLAAINFLSENNRSLKYDGMSSRDYPRNLSDAVIKVGLNAMNRSNIRAMEDVSLEVSRQNISSVYQYTGLTSNDLSHHQKHDLKILKTFVDNFRSDASFDDLIINARDNLRSSILTSKKASGIDPSIMFSISLHNGAGFGRPPEDEVIAKSLGENLAFARVSSNIAEAYDNFMKSRGVMHRLANHASELMHVRKLAPIAIALGLGVGVSAIMESTPPDLPVAEYTSQSDLRINAKAAGGETYFELGEKILRDAKLSHTETDVMRYMERTGLSSRQHETLREGDIITLIVPENVGVAAMSAWSSYGQVTEGGVPKSYTARDLTPYSQHNFIDAINQREQQIEEATGLSKG